MRVKVAEIAWHETQRVLSVDTDGAGRLATGGADGAVCIWTHKWPTSAAHPTVTCLAHLSARHTKPVNAVRFAPHGEYLASGGDDGLIFVWKYEKDKTPTKEFGEDGTQDVECWMSVMSFRGHEDVYDLAWSPDCGFLVSASTDTTSRVWDLCRGRQSCNLQEHRHYVQGVSWDPRNRFLVSCSSDRTVVVYEARRKGRARDWGALAVLKDLPNMGRIFLNESLPSFFRRPAWSPCGALLFAPAGQVPSSEGEAAVPQGTTYIFNRNNLTKPIAHLLSGAKPSVAVRCAPQLFKLLDGQQSWLDLPYRVVFAIASLESVAIYDTQHAQPLAVASTFHMAGITDLAWSHDSATLIVSSSDGYCSLVSFDEGELGVRLSPEEQRRHAGEPLAAVYPPPPSAIPHADADAAATDQASTAQAPVEGMNLVLQPAPVPAPAAASVTPLAASGEGAEKKRRIAPTFLGPATNVPR